MTATPTSYRDENGVLRAKRKRSRWDAPSPSATPPRKFPDAPSPHPLPVKDRGVWSDQGRRAWQEEEPSAEMEEEMAEFGRGKKRRKKKGKNKR